MYKDCELSRIFVVGTRSHRKRHILKLSAITTCTNLQYELTTKVGKNLVGPSIASH